MRNKTILFTILVFAVLLKVNAQSLTTCDYLIVAPSSFLASTTWDDDLISLQQSRGFTPYIYSVSDGTSASSIKSQIATAYYVGTVLKHVLIVGNGSSLEESDTATQSVEAPNIYIQQGTIIETTSFADGNYIPFWSVTSNNIWGTNGTSEVASDDPYIDGLTSRGDVFIGRIPAESINEISNYVDKLIAYYTNMSTYSDHNLKELYFGRDVTDTNNHCLGSSVVALRDSLITNHIPSHITTTILNVSDYIGTDAFAYSSTRASLFESALNSGVSLISMLSTSGGPVDFGGFYSNSDNANFNFTNISKQPFLLALNCMQGYVNDLRWSNYNQSTMRQLMMYEAGGIIGSIAPTEGSVQRINGKLLNLAHDKIYNDEIKHVGELNVILKAEIMQNYPDHEFYANGLTLFADPSMLLSVFRNKSGTISSSTTWEGNILVDSDVTVNSGVTLTIKAGASITFQNGARLKVDGILNVNGTSSNKVTFDFESPTYPNGIWFWLGGTGIINNAIIKNAYYGVRAYQSVATIKNSEIKNCTQGIQMDYLRGNTTGNMYVLNNSIHDIGYTGIYFNSSTGKVRDNEVYNCNVGTACSNYSSPDFGEVGYYGNNNFHNNRYYGFYASSNSNPFFGLSSCTTQGGENSFVDNTVYNGFAKYTCYVLAQGNWWGSNPPDESKIVTEYVSTIDFSFYLENPPGTLSANKVPTPEEIVYDTQFKSVVETAPGLSISSDSKSGFNSTWPILWKLRYARNLIGVEDYPFARKICKTIIDENPDSALATYALDLLWRASTNDKKSLSNFEDYLSKKVLSKKANVLFGDMSLILNIQDKTNSKNSNFDKIIDKYKGTRVEESAIFNKLVFSLNENNNREEAVNLLNVLQTNFPNSETIRLAQLELGLVVDEHLAPQLVKNASNEETTEIPKTYELLGNYPNPFNPSTTISYALPYSSNVELTIYDITGKVVKVFSESVQSAGYQNIVWIGDNQQGSRVSSGVYFYRFEAASLDGSGKVFEKTAKLLLLK